MSSLSSWIRRNGYGVVAAVALIAWMATWGGVSRTNTHEIRAILAIASGVLAVLWLLTGEDAAGLRRRLWRLACVLTAIVGLGNYYCFSFDWAWGLDDYTDPTYYYLNSKYYDELGSFGLYEGILLCDAEGPDHIASKLAEVRNLRDYQVEPAADALARAPEVKARFSPDRWDAFCHDSNWFISRKTTASLKSNFFVDHGYNPPPPWTLVGARITSAVPVESVKIAALLDVGICAGLFAAVAWGWGVDAMLLALLWWLVTISGRWPVMGQSVMRFDWIAAAVLGMAALRKGRPALAGAALLWGGLSRVFPAVFWGMAVIGLAADAAARRKAITPEVRRFALASALFGALVVGLSVADVGIAGWREAVAHLALHNSDPEGYSSQKVGAASAMVFRGETTRGGMRSARCGFVERALAGVECTNHGDAVQGRQRGNGIAGKGVIVTALKDRVMKPLGLAAIGLVCLLAWRTRRVPELLVPFGALFVYLLTTPSYYYYTLRVVLVIMHAADLRSKRNQVGLGLLFAVEAATNWMMTFGWERYTVTSAISVAMALYFAWLVGLSVWDVWRGRPER